MTNNINLATLFLLFIIFICTTINFVSYHNIDLAWNAKYLDTDNSLIDNNGIITQDLNTMYSRGMMTILISTAFMGISIYFYFLFEVVTNEKKI